MLDKLKNASGLTLIELVTAMFLVSILMIAIVSSNLFVQKFIRKWSDANTIYQEGDLLLSRISADLKTGCRFVRPDSIQWIIIKPSGDSIRYKITDGHLFRNDKRLNSEQVLCNGFYFKRENYKKIDPDSISVAGSLDHQTCLVSARLILSFKNLTDTMDASVRSKNEKDIF